MPQLKYNVFTGNFDLVATLADVSPLTTKGDLLVHDGTSSVRMGVGADNRVLAADSTEDEGVKWKVLRIPFIKADGTEDNIPLVITG